MLDTQQKKEPLAKISNFRDESGVSTRRLESGLWYLRHRKHFFLGVIVFLSLVSLGTMGYSLYKFSHYIIVGRDQDEQLYQDIGSSQFQLIRQEPAGDLVQISDVSLLLQQNNQADIVAKVTNGNPRAVLNLEYYFNVSGEQIGVGNDFVLPGDTKYIMALNQKLTSIQSGAELVITETRYTALPRGVYPIWQEYRGERLNLIVENATFVPGQDSGLSEKISLGELRFTITNQGGYSYRQLPLAIVLRQGQRIVSASRYFIDNFRSGEQKTVNLSWPGSWVGINQIEIIPDVNILDEYIYLQYSSE